MRTGVRVDLLHPFMLSARGKRRAKRRQGIELAALGAKAPEKSKPTGSRKNKLNKKNKQRKQTNQVRA
jgi:hypothetical protein